MHGNTPISSLRTFAIRCWTPYRNGYARWTMLTMTVYRWVSVVTSEAELWLTAVSTPNLATPVLIYCRKDCGELPLERYVQ